MASKKATYYLAFKAGQPYFFDNWESCNAVVTRTAATFRKVELSRAEADLESLWSTEHPDAPFPKEYPGSAILDRLGVTKAAQARRLAEARVAAAAAAHRERADEEHRRLAAAAAVAAQVERVRAERAAWEEGVHERERLAHERARLEREFVEHAARAAQVAKDADLELLEREIALSHHNEELRKQAARRREAAQAAADALTLATAAPRPPSLPPASSRTPAPAQGPATATALPPPSSSTRPSSSTSSYSCPSSSTSSTSAAISAATLPDAVPPLNIFVEAAGDAVHGLAAVAVAYTASEVVWRHSAAFAHGSLTQVRYRLALLALREIRGRGVASVALRLTDVPMIAQLSGRSACNPRLARLKNAITAHSDITISVTLGNPPDFASREATGILSSALSGAGSSIAAQAARARHSKKRRRSETSTTARTSTI